MASGQSPNIQDGQDGVEKRYTREEVSTYLGEIEKRLVGNQTASVHSVIALNQLLRLSYAPELFDDELKAQLKDIWIKLKSTGIQLQDPPVLFGLPENFGKEDDE